MQTVSVSKVLDYLDEKNVTVLRGKLEGGLPPEEDEVTPYLRVAVRPRESIEIDFDLAKHGRLAAGKVREVISQARSQSGCVHVDSLEYRLGKDEFNSILDVDVIDDVFIRFKPYQFRRSESELTGAESQIIEDILTENSDVPFHGKESLDAKLLSVLPRYQQRSRIPIMKLSHREPPVFPNSSIRYFQNPMDLPDSADLNTELIKAVRSVMDPKREFLKRKVYQLIEGERWELTKRAD